MTSYICDGKDFAHMGNFERGTSVGWWRGASVGWCWCL